ncbi:MAG TPA: nuclear transport factor 2 family protein [Panacibacter sp.]|nr:nuclear transport factor 2 family protein [Panacibacter sp.]HNP45078.1 nuclear transport factor 2 family protein [Panacibacter sp.]
MKRLVALLTVSLFFFTSKAQTMNDLNKRITELEDRVAIKNVVDTFSILADTKEIDKQVLLFTEDAEVESRTNGQSMVIKGRDQLKQAFSGFLANFHTVYHQNGQQTISLNGDRAEAVSYCRVILVGKQNDKEMKTTFYVVYKDSFVKQNGKWLIKHRFSDFVWTETTPTGQ